MSNKFPFSDHFRGGKMISFRMKLAQQIGKPGRCEITNLPSWQGMVVKSVAQQK